MDKQTFKTAYRLVREYVLFEALDACDWELKRIAYIDWLRATERVLKRYGIECDFNQTDMLSFATWHVQTRGMED
jgi:hypothetical protein